MPFDALTAYVQPSISDADLMHRAQNAISQPEYWCRRAFRRDRPFEPDAICPVEAIRIVCGRDGAARKRLNTALAQHMPWLLRCLAPQLSIIYYNDWFCSSHAALMQRMDRTIRALDRIGG